MFKNRYEAGKKLARKLLRIGKKHAVVFGITRGGVVVASEIAKNLKLPLSAIVIKKIGAPLNPELAVGALGPSKTIYWEKGLLKNLSVTHDYKVEASDVKNQEREELEDYLDIKKKVNLSGKEIILVDDGVATGTTVLCALKYFRKKKVKKVVLLTPVIAKDTYHEIVKKFDSIVTLKIAVELKAIGQYYRDFSQVENEEVRDIIRRQ